ncbi:MAG: BREX-3 system phosphatase PglZ [Bacillota bacterium]
MSNWRDHILRQFTPWVARLTLVADPDFLLLEERVSEGIRQRGFELIPFEDHVAFRYIYESRFRSRWDQGHDLDLVVVLHSQSSVLDQLPFDLLQAGRKLAFSLGDIFPNLSYPIVAALDRADLDALYDAQLKYEPDPLGENATKEFILRHVFEIAPELIKKPSDLLRLLIRLHYRRLRIPPLISERLAELLSKNGQFARWPVEQLISDQEAFFTFLQERWPIFLDRKVEKELPMARESEHCHDLVIPGPADIPFDHDDVRVYIDNLFTDGLLQPVPHDHASILSKSWVSIGIKTESLEDKARRLSKLVDSVRSSIPAEDARYTEWFRFARSWAELTLLVVDHGEALSDKLQENVNELRSRVDMGFTHWLLKRYAGLVSLPPSQPVMLHHLPHFLARQTVDDGAKVALVVVDGLAMDQWLIVREVLRSKKLGFRFREREIFAWIPSLTSVSRQTIFAGRVPFLFPESIGTTAKESTYWTQFWVDSGYKTNQVVYAKWSGDGGLDSVSEAVSRPQTRVVGLVVDMVDRIMHGAQMGTASMHNQVRQWLEGPYLSGLLDCLLSQGFRIYLTSDHGNIEAIGCGTPNEGAVADLCGARARVYPDGILRQRVKEKFPEAIEWDSTGLPQNYVVLVAPHRQAFVQKGLRVVCHGGIALEEIIVPLVEIERETR